MSALRKIQEDFRASVLGREDVIAPHVEVSRGPKARRIAVYRNTVQASLTDVLAVAFPVVKRIVGDSFFATLAHRFIAAHPPQMPQLSAYGAGLPAFIATAEPLKPLPYLVDVARLEWARGEAYFAADGEALAAEHLARVPPDSLPDLHLALHPATRVISSRYPIHRIWQVNQPEITDVPEIDLSVAEAAIVSRPAFQVSTRQLSLGDAAFVAAFGSGAALSVALDAALQLEPSFDVQTALVQHLIGGTFASLMLPAA